jgi:hypothetical protein
MPLDGQLTPGRIAAFDQAGSLVLLPGTTGQQGQEDQG